MSAIFMAQHYIKAPKAPALFEANGILDQMQIEDRPSAKPLFTTLERSTQRAKQT